MTRPVRVLDRRSVMVIAVVIAIVVVVVGRGKVDVRRRQDRGPNGGHHQNRGEKRTPQATCTHVGIMRGSRTRVKSTTVPLASRDGADHIKPTLHHDRAGNRNYLTIIAI